MNHADHVQLIAPGVPRGGVWAEMGSGRGAFTLALRDVAGPDVEIWSIDRDRDSLSAQRSEIEWRFPETRLHHIAADFTRELKLPPLDGILAANAIHFVPDRVGLLAAWRRYLRPGGRLVLVEYDTDEGNRWVPYPVSFRALPALAKAAGYEPPTLLHVRGSRFLDRIYAASMRVPAV